MKICQITPYWDTKGGITTVVTNLVSKLREKNNKVYILSSDLKQSDDNNFKLSSSFIHKNKEILSILRKLKPDAIHAHAHGTLLPGALIYKYFFNSKVCIICTFHTKPSSGSELTNTKDDRNKLRNKFVNFMMKLLDYNVFVSKDLVDSYKKSMDVTTKNNVVIYNGINIPEINHNKVLDLKNKLELKEDHVVFSMISTLQWDLKVIGVGTLLKAFDRFNKEYASNTKLFIAGDGQFKYYLEDILKNINNDNIKLLGHIDTVNELLFISDIYSHVSPLEGCSMAILEAMVMRKNILTVEGGGNGELIQNNINGIIVPYDEEKILKGLIEIYNRKNENMLRDNAYTDGITKYSWENISKQYINLYLKE